MPDFLREALSPGRWPVFVLIATRMAGLMLIAPLWSMDSLPRLARAAITVVLAILLLPSAPAVPVPERVLELPLPLAFELIIGLGIGLTAAVLVQGAAMAGEIIGIQTGITIGPALLPQLDLQGSALAQLHSSLAILVYLGVGGHTMLLTGLARSLEVLPPGGPLLVQSGLPTLVTLIGSLFETALRTAAPIMVTLLLVNLSFAILNRAIPQLNAMMLAFPATIAIGLLMLGITVEISADAMAGWFGGLPGSVARLLESFHPLLAR